MSITKLITSYTASQPCDSIEAHPDNATNGIVALCTYELDDAATQSKRGSVHLLRLSSPPSMQSGMLSVLGSLSTAAVFDAKWHPKNDGIIAIATADGTVNLIRCNLLNGGMDNEVAAANIEIIDTAQLHDAVPTSALSLDWTDAGSRCDNTAMHLLVSRADGYLSHCKLRESALVIEHSWRGHSLAGNPIEAWVIASQAGISNNVNGSTIAWSGGDDATIRGWDLRTSCANATFTSSTAHSAGVCAIAWSPHHEYLVATGSYDETALFWDSRNVKSPLCHVQCGGGVWRLRWHPTLAEYTLAACMHNGANILHFNNNEVPIALSHRQFSGHSSLTYGADWIQNVNDKRREVHNCYLAATCSFYDKLLCIWDPLLVNSTEYAS